MPEKQQSGLIQGWLSILAHPIETFRGLKEFVGWGKKGDAVTKDPKKEKRTR